MHTYLKQKLSQELLQQKASLARVESEILSNPKSDKEEDLLLHQQLQTEKERLENKIDELQNRIDDIDNEIVQGPIKVKIDDQLIKEFYIVAEELINPRKGLISGQSPLALELSSRVPGDVFELTTPAGVRRAEIL